MASHNVSTNLNLWKLSRLLADHERCIEWCKEHNLLVVNENALNLSAETHSNCKDELHRGMDLFGDALEKNCNGQTSIRQKS